MKTQLKTTVLTDQDKKLIETAKSLVNPTNVPGGIIKEVGCALITKNGKIYAGSSLDLRCGIGFCGEHSAIAEMISHSNETEIDTIVAFGEKIMYPCGRCRELMIQINSVNRKNCMVIISENEKIALNELIPGDWM